MEVAFVYVVTECLTPKTLHFLLPDGEFIDTDYDKSLLDMLTETYECYTCGYWVNVLQVHEKVINMFNKITFKSMNIPIYDEHNRLHVIREVYNKQYGDTRPNVISTEDDS